eukprot:6324808-Pyramimonas_sp.AAC.1
MLGEGVISIVDSATHSESIGRAPDNAIDSAINCDIDIALPSTVLGASGDLHRLLPRRSRLSDKRGQS